MFVVCVGHEESSQESLRQAPPAVASVKRFRVLNVKDTEAETICLDTLQSFVPIGHVARTAMKQANQPESPLNQKVIRPYVSHEPTNPGRHWRHARSQHQRLRQGQFEGPKWSRYRTLTTILFVGRPSPYCFRDRMRNEK